jgi:hypothetical protein
MDAAECVGPASWTIEFDTHEYPFTWCSMLGFSALPHQGALK